MPNILFGLSGCSLLIFDTFSSYMFHPYGFPRWFPFTNKHMESFNKQIFSNFKCSLLIFSFTDCMFCVLRKLSPTWDGTKALIFIFYPSPLLVLDVLGNLHEMNLNGNKIPWVLPLDAPLLQHQLLKRPCFLSCSSVTHYLPNINICVIYFYTLLCIPAPILLCQNLYSFIIYNDNL